MASTSVCVKALPGDNALPIASDPIRYFLTAPKPLAARVQSEFGEAAVGKKLRTDKVRGIVRNQK